MDVGKQVCEIPAFGTFAVKQRPEHRRGVAAASKRRVGKDGADPGGAQRLVVPVQRTVVVLAGGNDLPVLREADGERAAPSVRRLGHRAKVRYVLFKRPAPAP